VTTARCCLHALLGGLATLLALAVVAGIVALNQRREARNSALAADAQRLGAGALAQERLDRALLLARTGGGARRDARDSGNLLSVLVRTPAALGVLESDRRLLAGSLESPTAGGWP
jgi:hypothetical protein